MHLPASILTTDRRYPSDQDLRLRDTEDTVDVEAGARSQDASVTILAATSDSNEEGQTQLVRLSNVFVSRRYR